MKKSFNIFVNKMYREEEFVEICVSKELVRIREHQQRCATNQLEQKNQIRKHLSGNNLSSPMYSHSPSFKNDFDISKAYLYSDEESVSKHKNSSIYSNALKNSENRNWGTKQFSSGLQDMKQLEKESSSVRDMLSQIKAEPFHGTLVSQSLPRTNRLDEREHSCKTLGSEETLVSDYENKNTRKMISEATRGSPSQQTQEATNSFASPLLIVQHMESFASRKNIASEAHHSLSPPNQSEEKKEFIINYFSHLLSRMNISMRRLVLG